MKKEKLLDSYEAHGSDPEAFRNEVRELTDGTVCRTIMGEEILWMSQAETPDGETCLVTANCDPFGDVMVVEKSEVKMCQTTELNVEFWDGERLILGTREDGKYSYRSCHSQVAVDMSFLGISGPCVQKITPALVTMFQQQSAGKKLTIVSRTGDDGTEKIFGIRSGTYMYVPQTELLDITDEFVTKESGVLQSWHVSHTLTEAVYAFPTRETAIILKSGPIETVPQIRMSTSDSGDGSINWTLFWNVGGKNIELSSGELTVSRRHRGAWDEAEKRKIVAALDKLFEKLDTLKSKLESLDAIELYGDDPVIVLENLMDDNKRFKSFVNEKVREALIDKAKDTFVNLSHTAAEVVIFGLGIPNVLENYAASTLKNIAKACGEFPYMTLRGAYAIK